MNHNHYSFGLTALLMFICQSLSAHDFDVDGIYYTYLSESDKTVAVSSKETAYIENQKAYSGNVVIPPTVTYQGMTYSVTSIDWHAFDGCTGLTSIVIPNSVTSIGGLAFEGCTNLKKVCNCSSLTLTQGSSDYGYVACYAIAVHNNCQFDGDYVITYVNDLPYVCGYLGQETELTLPSTYGISDLAFYGCSGLTSIVIPDDVESIGDYAFYGCSGLTSIVIPDDVESIGEYAFCDCTGLTSIEIPNSVFSIGVFAFCGCTGTLIINCDIEDCEDTGVIYSFLAYRAQFSEVILGEEVNKVGRYAFIGVSSMKSLTIGSNVNNIGSRALDGCTGLTSIYCNAVNPPACSFGVFDMYTQKNCTLYVPSGSIDAYKAANA